MIHPPLGWAGGGWYLWEWDQQMATGNRQQWQNRSWWVLLSGRRIHSRSRLRGDIRGRNYGQGAAHGLPVRMANIQPNVMYHSQVLQDPTSAADLLLVDFHLSLQPPDIRYGRPQTLVRVTGLRLRTGRPFIIRRLVRDRGSRVGVLLNPKRHYPRASANSSFRLYAMTRMSRTSASATRRCCRSYAIVPSLIRILPKDYPKLARA